MHALLENGVSVQMTLNTMHAQCHYFLFMLLVHIYNVIILIIIAATKYEDTYTFLQHGKICGVDSMIIHHAASLCRESILLWALIGIIIIVR